MKTKARTLLPVLFALLLISTSQLFADKADLDNQKGFRDVQFGSAPAKSLIPLPDNGSAETWYKRNISELAEPSLFGYAIGEIRYGYYKGQCIAITVILNPVPADVNVLEDAKTKNNMMFAFLPLEQEVNKLYDLPDENSTSSSTMSFDWKGKKVSASMFCSVDFDTKSVNGEITFRSVVLTKEAAKDVSKAQQSRKDGI